MKKIILGALLLFILIGCVSAEELGVSADSSNQTEVLSVPVDTNNEVDELSVGTNTLNQTEDFGMAANTSNEIEELGRSADVNNEVGKLSADANGIEHWDIKTPNNGIKKYAVEVDDDGTANIYYDVKTTDKYENEGKIWVEISPKDYKEIKYAVINKKPLTKTYTGGGDIIKKVYKVKKYKGTVLINKKTLKTLKKALKKNWGYCTVYDENKWGYKAHRLINKLLNRYESKYIKIKVKGSVYKYSLFQKCYGDSRDYKYQKFYKVKLYFKGYNYKLKRAKMTCKLNVKDGKVSTTFYANNKLLNYKMFFTCDGLG